MLNRRYEARIGARDQSQLGFGGWSLSAGHDFYNHAGRVLYRGDGMRRTADGIGASVRVVAGVGRYGGAGDGGPALAAEFAIPDGITLDPTGIVYVSESIGHRVRKMGKGVVTLFAGTGTQGHTGDGGAATAATIDTPRSVTVLRDGRVCFAEQYADTRPVRRERRSHSHGNRWWHQSDWPRPHPGHRGDRVASECARRRA